MRLEYGVRPMAAAPRIRVCVTGVTGWTGSAVAEAVRAAPDMELVAGVSRSDRDSYSTVAEALAAIPVDVLVDYTHAEAVRGHVVTAVERGVAVVVGSSGLSADDYQAIDTLARETGVGVIAAGNFSLTAALLLRFAEEAARHLDAWEIVDYASLEKPDAPSGTAREIAERLHARACPGARRAGRADAWRTRGARGNGRGHAGALGATAELRRIDRGPVRRCGRAALDPARRRGDAGALRRRDASRDPGGRVDRGRHPRARSAALSRAAGGAVHARVTATYGLRMDDTKIHASIEQLVSEEHALWDREASGGASEADRRRLEEVKVSLDRCWDLLRQRRAREEFGMDPDVATARADDVVEGYQQ